MELNTGKINYMYLILILFMRQKYIEWVSSAVSRVFILFSACELDTSYFGNVVTFQDNVADLKTCQDWCASQNVWLFSYHETHNLAYPTLTQRCWCQTRLQPNKYHNITGCITGGVTCEKVWRPLDLNHYPRYINNTLCTKLLNVL